MLSSSSLGCAVPCQYVQIRMFLMQAANLIMVANSAVAVPMHFLKLLGILFTLRGYHCKNARKLQLFCRLQYMYQLQI